MHIVVWFQVFLSDIYNYMVLSNYFNLMIVIYLYTVIWFQATNLKLVDKFTYLGSSVSSTEKDIDTRLTKAWTAIHRLSIIWKSDLTDLNETQFLPSGGRIDTAVWMHYLDANKTAGEEARRQLHKNVASNIEQVWAATPHNAPTIRSPASHHENYPS